MKRNILAGAAALAAATLVLSGCGSDSGDKGGDKSGSGGDDTVASKLLLGGPPEFKTRRLQPLQTAYGIRFEGFKPLDTGGPLTVTALKNGQVDAADIFTSDPAIKANNFVILEDTKSFFGAQNVVPLIRTSKATAAVKQILNFISSKLTNEALIDLRTQVEVDKKDPAAVALQWLNSAGDKPPADAAKGVTLTVGSANFKENELLAQIYIVALKAAGANVKSKLNIGSREKYFPALKDGSIDLIPEYLGSILSYLDPKATAATADEVKTALPKVLPKQLEILDTADAQDNDAIVVTKATADKYGLKTIEDLAKKP